MSGGVCRKLYACGYNGFGQLPLVNAEGDGQRRSVTVPQECTGLPSAAGFSRLADYIGIGWSKCVLNKDGEVISHGFLAGRDRQRDSIHSAGASQISSVCCSSRAGLLLAVPASHDGLLTWKDGTRELEAVKVEGTGHSEERILSLDCTEQDDYVVTDENKVGRLHRSDEETGSFIYEPIFSERPVSSISCGKEHVMLLTQSGAVFTFGGGSRGQLGHGMPEDKHPTPSQVDALSAVRVTSISAGGWHAAVISEHSDLYIWGWNESGQLGFPMKSKDAKHIQHVTTEGGTDRDLNDADEVSTAYQNAHDSHISTSGNVEPTTFLMLPQILDMDPPSIEVSLVAVSCGSRHSAAVTADGQLFTWGFGRWGQLGHGNEWTQDRPMRLEGLGGNNTNVTTAVDVYCREWNTFILTEEKVGGDR